MKNIRVTTVSLLATLVLSAGSALAVPGYTTIGAPPAGESTHAQILDTIYGGTFSQSGLDYSNGPITATRVADTGIGGLLKILTGGPLTADDQNWSDGVTTVMMEAKYAGDQSHFGWFNDTVPSGFQFLLDTSAIGSNAIVNLSSQFRWGLQNQTTGNTWTSRESDNGPDQLVTYQVTGLGTGETVWLLFWEDRVAGQPFADIDFNDAVIEVRAVPAPGAGLLALAGLAIAGRRRR